jgi:hypothetical protein
MYDFFLSLILPLVQQKLGYFKAQNHGGPASNRRIRCPESMIRIQSFNLTWSTQYKKILRLF